MSDTKKKPEKIADELDGENAPTYDNSVCEHEYTYHSLLSIALVWV